MFRQCQMYEEHIEQQLVYTGQIVQVDYNETNQRTVYQRVQVACGKI